MHAAAINMFDPEITHRPALEDADKQGSNAPGKREHDQCGGKLPPICDGSEKLAEQNEVGNLHEDVA